MFNQITVVMENNIAFVAYLCLAVFFVVIGVLSFTGRIGWGIIATGSKTFDRRQRISRLCFCLLFALNSVLKAFDVDYPLWLILAQVVAIVGIAVYMWFLPVKKDE